MAAMASIPTLYRGVQYRSRLEAKWSAFFDLLNWPVQYEPFDLDGWIPDFVILGREQILVEVKPVDISHDASPPPDVVEKIGRSAGDFGVLLVGYTLWSSFDNLHLGWLRSPWGEISIGRCSWCWEQAVVFGVLPGPIGFTGYQGLWIDRVFVQPRGEHGICNPAVTAHVQGLWNRAGNLVQWRGALSGG